MANIAEILIATNGSDGSVTTIPELTPRPPSHACCLWCGRAFAPRATGGSAQKYCSTGHRQEFWIAARRWTMRAIDADLASRNSCDRAVNGHDGTAALTVIRLRQRQPAAHAVSLHQLYPLLFQARRQAGRHSV